MKHISILILCALIFSCRSTKHISTYSQDSVAYKVLYNNHAYSLVNMSDSLQLSIDSCIILINNDTTMSPCVIKAYNVSRRQIRCKYSTSSTRIADRTSVTKVIKASRVKTSEKKTTSVKLFFLFFILLLLCCYKVKRVL